MYSSIQASQLDMPEISGTLAGVLVTGAVVRPVQLEPFVTQIEQDSYELRILGIAAAGSGANYNTGQTILNLNYASGTALESGINASGLFIAHLFENRSSGIAATGLSLYQTLTGLSGTFNNTGLFLAQQVTGISGALNSTGLGFSNWLTGISGAMNATGLLNDPRRLSGIFNATGLLQAKAVQNLSGSMNLTGLSLAREIRNLSGSMNSTGLFLDGSVRNLSGSLTQTGRGLLQDINTLRNSGLTVNGLSGAVLITGTGLAITFINGQTLTVFINQPGDDPAKVIDLNSQTGLLFITGSGNLTVSTINTGIYISGIAGVSLSQTGILATNWNLQQTGQSLLARDLLWSGTIATQNSALHTGLSILNSLSGDITLTGQGTLSQTTGAGQIILSGGSALLPHWATSSPDITSGSAGFNDDFDTPYLANKWTGLGAHTWSFSGIQNSHFAATHSASGTNAVFGILLQGCTTGKDFEIAMKFNYLKWTDSTDNVRMGLIWRNATSQTSEVFDIHDNSLEGKIYNAFGYGSSYYTASGYSASASNIDDLYFRMQCRNKILSLDISNDDIIWRNIKSNYTTSISSINQVGISMGSWASQTKASILVDWFRATGLS